MADPPPYPGTPRWVKVSGIVVGVLVLLIAILVHAGGGPHHNIPSGDVDGEIRPSSLTQDSAPSGGGVAGHAPSEGGRR
jgi:hypothetical protein